MDRMTDPVWRALATMRIEPKGAALSFEARLAREQNWTSAHAAAVMEEYRRFLYLAATGREAVTPSDDVDAAWHLHLTYTRHYWEEMCGRILGRPIHHLPTEGGPAEAAKHRDQYRRTLAAYREVFGEAPPASVWPIGPAPEKARDRTTFWLRAGAGGGALALLAACGAAGGGDGEGSWPIFVVIGLSILGLYVVSAMTGGQRNRGSRGGDSYDHNDSCGSDGGSDSGCSSSCGSSCGGGGGD